MGSLLSCLESPKEEQFYRRKLVIVGDGGCGKTCLLESFLGKEFSDDRYIPTVFETKVLTLRHQGKEVELILYDTAGQEDYDRLRPFAYPDTDVILACFSVDETDSLVNIQERWIPEVRHFCGSDVPILLVGTKADLRSEESSEVKNDNSSSDGDGDNSGDMRLIQKPKKPLVSTAEAERLAERTDLAAYFETSAKTNSGVTEVLQTALSASLDPKSFTKRRKRNKKNKK